MTIQSPSHATLQDVLNAIDGVPTLTGKRKQDLRSAVRLTAKVLNAEPYLIAADPRGLGRKLDGVSAISLGLSAGRWANCRSLLRSALRLVTPVMAGAVNVPLSADWEALAVEARKAGSCWQRLGRLVRWLSLRGLTPASVTREDINQFRSELSTDALLGQPEAAWQAARRSWEHMRSVCPTWPQVALEKAPNPLTYSLPWDAYPVSLKADVDKFIDHLSGKDFREDSPARPLRPLTLKLRMHDLRSFAAALVHQGVDPRTLTSLATCLTLDNYKLGLQWFYKRSGSKPSATLHNIAANLRQTARHWLKADDAMLTAMSKIVRKLAPTEQGMSDKNRDRMRPFNSHENIKAVANLPQSICRHLETSRNTSMRKAGLSTAAMAIELLLVAPIRLSNLCQLHLDHHFIKVGKKIHLFIPKEEVKNRMDLEFELPPQTVQLLDWYVSTYRKAEAHNRFLFASESVHHKKSNTLRTQIMKTVKSFTGFTVNPHLFRHIAGSIYLHENPGAYEVVRQVLGHRNIATTTSFYTGQEERRARQHFIGVIQKLRDNLEPSRRRWNVKP